MSRRTERARVTAASLAAIAVVALAGLLAISARGGNGPGTATASARLAAGTLNLRGTLTLNSDLAECPPGAPPDATECRGRTGEGVIPGLGRATDTYLLVIWLGPPTCPADAGKPVATTGRLAVKGKGEIDFALADGTRCTNVEAIR